MSRTDERGSSGRSGRESRGKDRRSGRSRGRSHDRRSTSRDRSRRSRSHTRRRDSRSRSPSRDRSRRSRTRSPSRDRPRRSRTHRSRSRSRSRVRSRRSQSHTRRRDSRSRSPSSDRTRARHSTPTHVKPTHVKGGAAPITDTKTKLSKFNGQYVCHHELRAIAWARDLPNNEVADEWIEKLAEMEKLESETRPKDSRNWIPRDAFLRRTQIFNLMGKRYSAKKADDVFEKMGAKIASAKAYHQKVISEIKKLESSEWVDSIPAIDRTLVAVAIADFVKETNHDVESLLAKYAIPKKIYDQVDNHRKTFAISPCQDAAPTPSGRQVSPPNAASSTPRGQRSQESPPRSRPKNTKHHGRGKKAKELNFDEEEDDTSPKYFIPSPLKERKASDPGAAQSDEGHKDDDDKEDKGIARSPKRRATREDSACKPPVAGGDAPKLRNESGTAGQVTGNDEEPSDFERGSSKRRPETVRERSTIDLPSRNSPRNSTPEPLAKRRKLAQTHRTPPKRLAKRAASHKKAVDDSESEESESDKSESDKSESDKSKSDTSEESEESSGSESFLPGKSGAKPSVGSSIRTRSREKRDDEESDSTKSREESGDEESDSTKPHGTLMFEEEELIEDELAGEPDFHAPVQDRVREPYGSCPGTLVSGNAGNATSSRTICIAN